MSTIAAKIGKCDTPEHFIDAIANLLPNATRHALPRARARMRRLLVRKQAVDECDRSFRCGNDIADRDLFRGTRKFISPLRAARTRHESRFPQRAHELFEIILRKSLAQCDGFERHDSLAVMLCEFI